MIESIELPASLDRRTIPSQIELMIQDVRQRVETFQDRWQVNKLEQFVAADYWLVYRCLDWIRETQMLIGNRFLEWGAGFAAVTLSAHALGFDAIGIESEGTLVQQGRQTVEDWWPHLGQGNGPELLQGNFLPQRSERLAEDPTLPSLGHALPAAYADLGLELADFALVYSYPWPGEDDFHEIVFDQYAQPGAIHVQFCGPNDVRAWRKTR